MPIADERAKAVELALSQIEKRAADLMLHSRINYAYRRLQEYLRADRTWGANHAASPKSKRNTTLTASSFVHNGVGPEQ